MRQATFQEREELRKLCQNRANWGGDFVSYWQGPGPEPSCFGKKIIAESTQVTDIHFVSETGWKKWNKIWDDRLNFSNGCSAIATTILLYYAPLGKLASSLSGGLQSIGSGLHNLKLELPEVSQGWKARTILRFTLTGSAMKSDALVKTTTLQTYAPSGRKFFDKSKSIKYDIQGQHDFNAFIKIASLKSGMRRISK